MTVTATRTLNPARVLDEAIAALNTPGAALPLDEVDRALKIAPGDPRLWHVKGLIHREEERRELAIPALRRAVELAPDEPLITHGLARTLLEAGLPAVEEFGCAMRLSKSDPQVVQGLVSALVAQGRVAEAIEGLERVLESSPLWTGGHTLLASLRWSEGERHGFTRSSEPHGSTDDFQTLCGACGAMPGPRAPASSDGQARPRDGRGPERDLRPPFIIHHSELRIRWGSIAVGFSRRYRP